jgi:hypothetical protein
MISEEGRVLADCTGAPEAFGSAVRLAEGPGWGVNRSSVDAHVVGREGLIAHEPM